LLLLVAGLYAGAFLTRPRAVAVTATAEAAEPARKGLVAQPA